MMSMMLREFNSAQITGKVKIWVVRLRSFTWTSLSIPVNLSLFSYEEDSLNGVQMLGAATEFFLPVTIVIIPAVLVTNLITKLY